MRVSVNPRLTKSVSCPTRSSKLEALRHAKHDHSRRQTRELDSKISNPDPPKKTRKTPTRYREWPRRAGRRLYLIACALCCCSQIKGRSQLVPISDYSSAPEPCNASLSSASHLGRLFVSTYTRQSGVTGRSAVRAREDLRDLREAVRMVPREPFGRRIGRGGNLWSRRTSRAGIGTR